jgi:anti-anti-sigma factor
MFEIQPLGRPGEFALVGELDMCSAPELLTALGEQAHGGELRLFMDQLAFCDAAGIHALIKLARMAQRITLVHPRPSVSCVFEIVGLGDVSGIVVAP